MNKIQLTKINRSNNDIWTLLKIAIESKNIALIEQATNRLYSLQKYYIDLINFQDMEISQLKDLLSQETAIRNSFEKEWIEEVAKKEGFYENLRARINETYGQNKG